MTLENDIKIDKDGRKYVIENDVRIYIEEIDVKVPQSEKDVEGLEYITE